MRFVSTVQKFLFTAIFLFSSASFAAQGEVNISSETQVDKTTEEVLEVFSAIGKSFEKQRKTAAKKCKSGDMESCEQVGIMHRYGLGGPVDNKIAYSALQKACEAKRAKACLDYGRMASSGLGGEQNREAAFSAFDFACNADLQKACTNVGVHYQFGWGVKQDMVLAKQIYAKSCLKGENVACHNQAVLWLQEGGSGNQTLARYSLHKNCDAGYKASCNLLLELPDNP